MLVVLPLTGRLSYASQGAHAVCDGSGEDPTCSNAHAVDVNIVDHLEYVGFDMVSNYLFCKL